MRWIVLGMVLATALIVALAVIVGSGTEKEKRHRAPRAPQPPAALVRDLA
jgi:hypothetical protein